MSTINIEVTKNVYDVDLQHNVTSYEVTLEKGYYPLPGGGGGGGDTSNLVPYTGATKNVNIGAYYFESSAGFKTPTGTANQSLTANGGIFDLTTKADLVGGKVPSSQLPSYVDDVLEFANLASFPATGESGKIYIAIDTNLTYRWGGSSYVIMSSSLALGETESTAYRGDRGKIAYDHSQTTGNPHGTTKNDIGLGNVPNLDTTNAVNNSHTHSNKSILDLITEPFTTSLQSLYDGAVTRINNISLTGLRLITSGEITKLTNTSGTNTGDETTSSIQTKRPLKTIEGQSLEGSGNIDLTKNDIGLGNIDNTSDLNKPISTATQNALNTKANIVDIPSKTSFTHNILVSNWTLVSGKYEAVISNAGILENSFVDVIPSNDNVDIVRSAQIYPSVLISAGSVKVYSKFLPSNTITVTININ